MLMRFMFTKRIILLIIGIFVAIAICLSTSLFGMKMARTAIIPQRLEAYANVVLVIDWNLDGKPVVAEF